MKFKRSGGGPSAKDPVPIKSNLRTIDNQANKKYVTQKKKAVNFKLEGKENKLLAMATASKCTVSDALSERMAQGLNLFSGSKTMEFKEAKPIAKPVLSCFMDGSQNYFKRSFSMRARSSNSAATQPSDQEMKTATIRRAFGKSLTSKEYGYSKEL